MKRGRSKDVLAIDNGIRRPPRLEEKAQDFKVTFGSSLVNRVLVQGVSPIDICIMLQQYAHTVKIALVRRAVDRHSRRAAAGINVEALLEQELDDLRLIEIRGGMKPI